MIYQCQGYQSIFILFHIFHMFYIGMHSFSIKKISNISLKINIFEAIRVISFQSEFSNLSFASSVALLAQPHVSFKPRYSDLLKENIHEMK